MNSNGTTYQNGRFANVDEVHNNTKNMTLSGFNQEGGTVTGNIENLTIESKQNESETSGSSYGASLGIAPNGTVNGSANYSNTNGERRYIDTPSSFVIGEGSNLKVDKAKNTAGIIGTTDNGKLKINEYVGKNLDNKDQLKTVGGSVGFNQSGISSFGVNYENKDLEATTKNTVIGNVEIEKSTCNEINRDIDTMTKVTKDKHFKTDISVESQTLNYIKNPDKFKEDLGKAKDEINDVAYAIEKSIKDPGEDNRNAFEQLRETRFIGTFNNIAKEKLETLNTADEIADVTKMTLADMGYDDVDVIFSDPAHAPQLIDKNGKTKSGTAYADKETGRRTIIINANDPKNSDRAKLIGTLSEKASHIVNKIEGRQKKVPTEKGLESTGRASNTYQQDKYGKNTTKIAITSDGKDYSNVDFGENVGDNPIILAAIIGSAIGGASFYKFYKNTEAIINKGIENVKNKENVEKYIKTREAKGVLAMSYEMAKEFKDAGFSIFSNELFAIYGATDEIRKIYLKKELDKENNKMVDTLVLDKFFPEETKRLWKSDKTFENLYKVTYFWYDKANKFGEYEIDYDNRERSTRARPDFTWSIKNSEFYALGTTLLFQSTYGSIKKTKYDKYVEYDVDIKVIFQYKDKFEDVKNVNPFQNAAQNKGMEFEGGVPFDFRTEPREVSVKGKFTNIKDIEIEIKKNMLKQLEEE